MGNSIFLRIKTKIMTMARKTSAILDKNRPNAWWDYMIDSNVLGEWKEIFRLSQLTPTFSFGRSFVFSLSRQRTVC